MKVSTKTLFILLLLRTSLFAQIGAPGYFEKHLEERLAKGLVFDIIQDQRGFMWFGTEYGLVQYDGYDLRYFQYDPGNPYSLAGNVVTCLLEDEEGLIWVGTLSSGLHRFDPKTERFIRFSNASGSESGPSDYRINDLAQGQDDNIWIATEGGGINRWNAEKQEFDHLLPPGRSADNQPYKKARILHHDKQGKLWAGTQEGLTYWDPGSQKFVLWSPDTSRLVNVNALTTDNDGRLWIGTRQGKLFFIQDDQLEERVLPESFSSENDHTIHTLCVSPGGRLWIGTDDGLIYFDDDYPEGIEHFFQNSGQVFSFFYSESELIWMGSNNGIVKVPLRRPKFHRNRLTISRDGDTLKPGVSAVISLNDQQLLIGSFQGPFLMDKENGRIHRDLSAVPGLSFFDHFGITALWKDQREGIWIASLTHFDGGFELFRLSPDGSREDFSARYALFRREVIRDIGEDQQGNIWFGTGNGLVRYDPKNDSLRIWTNDKSRSKGLPDNHIRRIFFDHNDQLWLGTDGEGLARYHPETDEFTVIKTAHSQVLDIAADTNNVLWLATQGGLNRLDPTTMELSHYSKNDGLPDNTVKSLAFDHKGFLWIGTKNGFARLAPEKREFHTFNREDGIQHEEYWEHIKLQEDNGWLFFGGAGGFNYFNPDNISWNLKPPPVLITEFQLFNQTVYPSPDAGQLSQSISFTDQLKLLHQHKVMTFRYTALNYHNSAKNRFAYQLEGFDQDWQYVGDRREVTYTNLDPGTYRFKVKATNDDGIWNDTGAVMELIVQPPWFASGWAYLLYLLLLSSGLYFLYRFQLNRRLAEAETIRLKELDAIKTQLYTNITHEFRTPLTLIQGPVEKALKDQTFSLKQPDLERIRQNCRRLLHLIRQMLHLNKIEAGAFDLSYTYSDVVPLIKYIVDSFSSFAQTQEVKLHLQVPDTAIEMDHDHKRLIDILSNLISNAIKFTPPGGTVSIEVSSVHTTGSPQLYVHVKDTGIGIQREDLDKVFDRFYQVKRTHSQRTEEVVTSGSGIGLALSKKLSELMEGNLSVKSKPGRGSVFSLSLPIRRTKELLPGPAEMPEIYVPHQAGLLDPEGMIQHNGSREAAKILIVEDNADLANFIAEDLFRQFQVHICTDGVMGLEWATEQIPDLIISDVLMPRMDGYELTKRLKADQRTSHIPIILLTAKTDLSSRVTGFGLGADAYMAKPFNSEELLIRIENLLESRRRLQQHYLKETGYGEALHDSVQASEQEHTFLKKVRSLIEEHLEEGDYSIEKLAGDLFMSSAQLYRKMMALTGLSPSKFYRNIQISRAKECLITTDLSISEIAYCCGFNDPAYFSRVFTAKLGNPPSTFREQEG